MDVNEKIVKQWFVRLLISFRIYSPLYKVTVIGPDEEGLYLVEAMAEPNSIECENIIVKNGHVTGWTHPQMIYRKEITE